MFLGSINLAWDLKYIAKQELRACKHSFKFSGLKKKYLVNRASARLTSCDAACFVLKSNLLSEQKEEREKGVLSHGSLHSISRVNLSAKSL